MTQLESQNRFLEAYENSACNITVACRNANIVRQTFYDWRNNDKLFAKKLHAVEEGLIDMVESKLLKKIKNDDGRAIEFFLKAKAKSRGYYDKQEIAMGGECTIISVTGQETPRPPALMPPTPTEEECGTKH
jgi:hypothetical protein